MVILYLINGKIIPLKWTRLFREGSSRITVIYNGFVFDLVTNSLTHFMYEAFLRY